MYLKQGDVVYRYTVKDNTMRVREGIVNIRGYGLYINFVDGGQGVQCPRVEDIGVVRTVGPTLWLTERNDILAKKLFVKYESHRIAELEELIARKRGVIAALSEGIQG